MPLGAPITQAITNGLGLAVEAVHAVRHGSKDSPTTLDRDGSKKADISTVGPTQSRESVPPPYSEADPKGNNPHAEDSTSDDEEEEDEKMWALDETSNQLEQPISHDSELKLGIGGQPTMESLSNLVLSKTPPIPSNIPLLEMPVIIPQRRPGTSGRGFIHAYAPVLQESGIPQDTFLTFLKTFHRASQASPVLNVIYLSAGVVGLVPHTATMVTSIVVQVAVGTAIALQKLHRTNSFLDEMNEKLFRPRGKYALIMTYQPDAQKAIEAKPTDLNEMIYKRSTKDGFKIAKGMFKIESGKTYAEVDMPESAPLVFPGLEQETEIADLQKVSSGKKSQKFLANYYDRRAQAVYMKNNPTSNLALPESQKPQFASWLSDPNDPRNNGSLITLLSGGKINIVEKRKNWEAKRAAKKAAVDTPQGVVEPEPVVEMSNWRKRQVKRVMKKGVLYLMIVNMPTEEEMVAAREKVHAAESKHS